MAADGTLNLPPQTYSPNFAPAASDPSKRDTFARSCVKLVEDYGLDGIDIDWEYPKNEREAKDYVELLRAVRHALDELAAGKLEANNGYELTIAAVSADEGRLGTLATTDQLYLSPLGIRHLSALRSVQRGTPEDQGDGPVPLILESHGVRVSRVSCELTRKEFSSVHQPQAWEKE